MTIILRCHNVLCRTILDEHRDGNYCSPGCRVQHERIVSKLEPLYAPLRVHTGRTAYNRIHSSKIDRS